MEKVQTRGPVAVILLIGVFFVMSTQGAKGKRERVWKLSALSRCPRVNRKAWRDFFKWLQSKII